ncbi:type II secretion system protein [Candidatus Similichlamydia epinepheli]|uniref:type II secretion system protein n=1 Tax=Candidatus Similichlamydia epinepheli TaxID=1903953 RepID=UPI000D3928A7|nr:type II secretion system protein [Candidatus Similichlamydia epinepheli]
MKKRTFFSLLEATISIALFGTLLAVLTGTFFRLSRLNSSLKEVEGDVLDAHLFDSFFRELIESSCSPFPLSRSSTQGAGNPLPRTFFTNRSGTILYFLYSPQADHPFDLSTFVHATLLLDNGRLRLDRRSYSPLSGFGSSVRTNYFFQNIRDISFKFYCGFYPSEEWSVEGDDRKPPFEVSEWSDYSVLPTSVLLSLTMESEKREEFGYRLRSVPIVLKYE